jgi:hypothetical protein
MTIQKCADLPYNIAVVRLLSALRLSAIAEDSKSCGTLFLDETASDSGGCKNERAIGFSFWL